MKVKMENVGLLPEIEVDLSGLTVVTGLNGTGKSTLLKALYCVFIPSFRFEERKNLDSIQVLKTIIRDSLGASALKQGDDVFQLLSQADSIPDEKINENGRRVIGFVHELMEGKRDNEFYCMQVQQSMISEFGSLSQVINMASGGEARITIVSHLGKCIYTITPDSVSWTGDLVRLRDVVYYDTPFIFDDLYQKDHPLDPNHRVSLASLLHEKDISSSINAIVGMDSTSKLEALISEILDCEIISDASAFITSDGYKIDIRNMAAGMKFFAVIRILAKKGLLNDRMLLILDEPEVHLHPKWINILAKVITVLVKDIGVRVIMTSHSSQLLMALEGYTLDSGLSPSYYMLRSVGKAISFMDVTSESDEMYGEMAEAIGDADRIYWGANDDHMV